MVTISIKFNQVSLLSRIKKAETKEELASLSMEGDEYKFASDKTRRRWEKASLARKSQLLNDNEKSEPKPKPQAKIDKKGAKKGRNQ